MNKLQELLLEELADMHDAERQLVKALPKMAKAAASPKLRAAFENHLEETKVHVDRIEQAFRAMDVRPKANKCEAMKGLMQEGEEIIADFKGTSALDAGLISAAQKVEHYEIASYGCLATWAEALGLDEVKNLLGETLEEEKAADERLTNIAEDSCNAEAIEDGAKLPRSRGEPALRSRGRRKLGIDA